MDSNDFRKCAKEMVDYVSDYLDNIETRPVLPKIKPGYLKDLIPDKAPDDPENWNDLMKDIERVIMPGITHWHSPHFHAFFPTANSYPSICADILSDAIACIGFSWIASPACTELEVVMMDWLAKIIKLPSFYLASSGGLGGGVIQGTASEAVLAHSCVERATLLASVICRKLPIDSRFSLRGDTLKEAIEKDKKNGFFPFYVCATLGTTSICSYDNLEELGPICKQENIWLNVDAAYAGSAFICDEFRYLLNGIEYTDSYVFNPHKWMLITFDCSALWVRDRSHLVDAFNVDPLYLKHKHQNTENFAPDFRHWQIPLGRRFRSLKIWFVLRLFGVKRIQEYIRKHVNLAKYFESLIISDNRFEIIGEVTLGLVCFRLKNYSNETNEKLLKNICDEGKIFMVPSKINDVYFIRFAVCAYSAEKNHVDYAWSVILKNTEILLSQNTTT